MLSIKQYYRPQTLDEALTLLKHERRSVLLAGGTKLIPSRAPGAQAVIDLQSVGLDELSVEGSHLRIGAMVPLQRLVESSQAGDLLSKSASLEGPITYRNAATIGGTIAVADPRSYLLTALLALDTQVHLRMPDPATVSLDRILDAPHKFLDGGIITGITTLSPAGARGVAMAHVARTPRDQPIVTVAVRITCEGKRCNYACVALAGVADRPLRAYQAEDLLKGRPFDKSLMDDTVTSVIQNLTPPSDFRGSSEYRHEMAAVLTRRALQEAWEKLTS